MKLVPFSVVRYGIYGALAVAAVSVWLGFRAGASLDYVVLRGVIVFAVFVGLAASAEAILMWPETAEPSHPRIQDPAESAPGGGEPADEPTDERMDDR